MDKYFLCLLVLHGFCNFISDCIPSNFVASMCSICLWKQGRTKKVHRKVHRNWITNFGWHFVFACRYHWLCHDCSPWCDSDVYMHWTRWSICSWAYLVREWKIHGNRWRLLQIDTEKSWGANIHCHANDQWQPYLWHLYYLLQDLQGLTISLLAQRYTDISRYLVTYSCLRCSNLSQLARPLSLYNVSRRSSSFTWKRSHQW